MNTDPGIASGYRPYSPSTTQLRNWSVGNLQRERTSAQNGSRESGLWPNLPERCFGADRQLPEWLVQPWLLLQEAAQRKRPLAERLADLTRVAQVVDDLFAIHLPDKADWFKSKEAEGLSLSKH